MARARTRRLVALLPVVGLLLAGCGSDGAASSTATVPAGGADTAATAGGDAPLVMATTTILGDLVARVVGDQARVEVLMGPGEDPHTFSPSAQQARQLREADLVVANGLGLEASVGDVIEAAEQDGTTVLHVAEQLDPLAPGESGEEHEAHADEDGHEDDGHGHDHEDGDPHVWFDPVRMADAVGLVADALDEVAEGDWQSRADAVAAELRELDEQVAATLSTVPEACRRLVTNHDNLGYLAARYDLEVVTTVLPGTSTGVEPSAQDFAAAVEVVRDTGVPAIFVETTSARRLADALAAEVGRDVAVVELYTDALGEPGSGADTYAGLLTTDAQRIAEALRTCEAAS